MSITPILRFIYGKTSPVEIITANNEKKLTNYLQ